jgi:hypothetical protein
MLAESTVQRLAFIRYLYNIAIEQSRQPEPLGAASILTFHDSIELFLQLASEHLNAGTKRPGFIDYWDLLEPKLPSGGLAQKESMRRLNKSRVALKHHGTLPSKLDIEAFRASATNFFEENTPLAFCTELNSISMVNLVKCTEARSSLEEASKLIEEGRTEDTLDKIAIAFAQLVDDYEDRKRTRFGRSPFFFGESLTFESSFSMGIQDHKFAGFVDKVRDSIEAMQSAMKILSLGLDYRRYVKFRLFTPQVTKVLSGDYHISRGRRDALPSIEECHFCYDLVVESAIRLQDFDFEVEI